MAMNETVLQARELYRFYHGAGDDVFALRGVSLEVAAGEIVAIAGPSGSGKSTLLACCGGLEEPDGGRVTVAGAHLTRRPESERAALRARTIGIVLQSGNLFPHLSVTQNVALARTLARTRARGRDALGQLGLDTRRHAAPGELSGGELARAALAVAIANEPKLLLADEPTGELDDHTARGVLALLKDLAHEGTAIVVATHSATVAEAARRILRLEDGRIVDDE